MKINISMTVFRNSDVFVHDGDTLESPFNFRELITILPQYGNVSELRRMQGNIVKAISEKTFKERLFGK